MLNEYLAQQNSLSLWLQSRNLGLFLFSSISDKYCFMEGFFLGGEATNGKTIIGFFCI